MASKAALATLSGSNPSAPIMMNAASPSAYSRQHFLSEPVNRRFHWRSTQQEGPRLYESSSGNNGQSSITNNSPGKAGSD
eukprot:scaffold600014_cov29-Prasinocladus_malaysianus.AAC.1